MRVARATGDPDGSGSDRRVSRRIDLSPGWYRGEEAQALALISHSLPEGAGVVEIGSFLGSGTLLLGRTEEGARFGKGALRRSI